MASLSNKKQTKTAKPRLKNVIECLPGCVYWKDSTGVYFGCNQVFLDMVGLDSEAQVVGKTDKDVVWKADADALRAHDLSVMQSRTVQSAEEEVTLASGERRFYSVVKAPLMGGRGNVVGVVGTSIDITSRRKMELYLSAAKEKADIANKAKTEFIENMSHDIRTPLTGILGAAELIASNPQGSMNEEIAKKIVSAGYSLLDVLNEIMEYAKTISGVQQPVAYKKFSPKALSEYVINLFKPAILRKNLKLTLEVDENIPEILIGDAFRLKHILINLISNAIKFTEKGKVNLRLNVAKQTERQLILTFIIEDTGIGMPKEKLEEIYTKFVRLLPSYQGKYRGAGLGLTITKRFITEIDGEIDVTSQQGIGTCFTCVIPLQKSLLDFPAEEYGFASSYECGDVDAIIALRGIGNNSDALEEREDAASEILPDSKQYRVLLVEDVPLAQLVAKSKLEPLSCIVDTAGTGEEAVEKAKKEEYSLIFMDIGLPGIDGYEAVQQIRAWEGAEGRRPTPIVALTSHADMCHEEKSIKCGMQGLLIKPLTIENALETLQAHSPTIQKPGVKLATICQLKKAAHYLSTVLDDRPDNKETLEKVSEQLMLEIDKMERLSSSDGS